MTNQIQIQKKILFDLINTKKVIVKNFQQFKEELNIKLNNRKGIIISTAMFGSITNHLDVIINNQFLFENVVRYLYEMNIKNYTTNSILYRQLNFELFSIINDYNISPFLYDKDGIEICFSDNEEIYRKHIKILGFSEFFIELLTNFKNIDTNIKLERHFPSYFDKTTNEKERLISLFLQLLIYDLKMFFAKEIPFINNELKEYIKFMEIDEKILNDFNNSILNDLKEKNLEHILLKLI